MIRFNYLENGFESLTECCVSIEGLDDKVLGKQASSDVATKVEVPVNKPRDGQVSQV